MNRQEQNGLSSNRWLPFAGRDESNRTFAGLRTDWAALRRKG